MGWVSFGLSSLLSLSKFFDLAGGLLLVAPKVSLVLFGVEFSPPVLLLLLQLLLLLLMLLVLSTSSLNVPTPRHHGSITRTWLRQPRGIARP